MRDTKTKEVVKNERKIFAKSWNVKACLNHKKNGGTEKMRSV